MVGRDRSGKATVLPCLDVGVSEGPNAPGQGGQSKLMMGTPPHCCKHMYAISRPVNLRCYGPLYAPFNYRLKSSYICRILGFETSYVGIPLITVTSMCGECFPNFALKKMLYPNLVLVCPQCQTLQLLIEARPRLSSASFTFCLPPVFHLRMQYTVC